jgi:Spy/CpxP family protein refolding chaperone
MRHISRWPWRYAYAASFAKACATACSTSDRSDQSSNFQESRWHHNSGGSGFGVRRPLRYLSHHLDLDESQVRRLATVLNSLKTEREQVELDEKRTVAAMANLLESGTPTLDEVREVLDVRVKSAELLKEETAKSLVSISDFLDEDQRQEFIKLLLTNSFSL